MTFEERYSRLETDSIPQEIVLLMGKGCFYKKCSFCDYHLDQGTNEVSIPLNHRVLDRVTGEFGRLTVLNSGSYFELPKATQRRILTLCRDKGIEDLHMESHWLLRDKTRELKDRLREEGICLHPRIGIETFDEVYREDVMNKGMGRGVSAGAIAEIYDECCLLFGMAGQSCGQFLEDVKIAKEYFSRVYINVFNDNSTEIKADPRLIKWIGEKEQDYLKKDPQLCVLVENTELGVGD